MNGGTVDLDVHLIVDNYSTHSIPEGVKAWLAGTATWRLHFVPTYSSWLGPGRRSLR